jgi:hypothetical protein
MNGSPDNSAAFAGRPARRPPPLRPPPRSESGGPRGGGSGGVGAAAVGAGGAAAAAAAQTCSLTIRGSSRRGMLINFERGRESKSGRGRERERVGERRVIVSHILNIRQTRCDISQGI